MDPAGILLLLAFPVGPSLLGAYAWWRTRGSSRPGADVAVPLWPGMLNASLCVALAFNVVYFVQEFFLAWPKSLLPGVDAVVYHNNHNWSGDHPDVILYQGAGALAIIVLGALLAAIVSLPGKFLRGAHAIVWWTGVMALGLGLIQVSIAAMHPDNDVGQAFDFLELSTSVRQFLAFLSLASVIFFGTYLVRPLLAMAPTGTLASPRSRVVYTLKFAVIPLVAGTVVAWANRAPPIGHLTMPLFSGLFILPWTLAAAAITAVPAPVSDRLHRGVNRPLIILSLVVLMIFRLVLAPGLHV